MGSGSTILTFVFWRQKVNCFYGLLSSSSTISTFTSLKELLLDVECVISAAAIGLIGKLGPLVKYLRYSFFQFSVPFKSFSLSKSESILILVEHLESLYVTFLNSTDFLYQIASSSLFYCDTVFLWISRFMERVKSCCYCF